MSKVTLRLLQSAKVWNNSFHGYWWIRGPSLKNLVKKILWETTNAGICYLLFIMELPGFKIKMVFSSQLWIRSLLWFSLNPFKRIGVLHWWRRTDISLKFVSSSYWRTDKIILSYITSIVQLFFNNDKPQRMKSTPVYTSKQYPKYLVNQPCSLVEAIVKGKLWISPACPSQTDLDLEERDPPFPPIWNESSEKKRPPTWRGRLKKVGVKSLESIWKDEASRRKYRNILDPIPPIAKQKKENLTSRGLRSLFKERLMEKMLTGPPISDEKE